MGRVTADCADRRGAQSAVPRSLPRQTVRGHTREESGTDVAVKLRLMRMGKKKQPTYRVVAADSRKARNGRIIEAVGFYDPRRDPSVIEIDNEKAVEWLRNGAQPTERVEKLLKITGAWDEFKGQPVVPASPRRQSPLLCRHRLMRSLKRPLMRPLKRPLMRLLPRSPRRTHHER